MSSKRKLLTISDAISASTGLGRIHRDLVTRILENLSDVYDVATMGYGGVGTTKIKVPQFPTEGQSDWVLPSLPAVCEDFFGSEKGTILVISDAHRWSWLAAPRGCSELFTKFPGLQQWAMSRPFKLWGYLPIDSSGPNDRLAFPIMKTLLGFDRLLAYGNFGEGVIRKTIGDEESDKRHLTNLPHGTVSDDFYEHNRLVSRSMFLQFTMSQSMLHMLQVPGAVTAPIEDDECLIGIVCTNQSRKDIPLALETCSILSRSRKIRVWLHTDQLERAWSIPSLLIDYGLIDKALISLGQISDQSLASAYSACDLTIGPGAEGFGLPLLESQFCGCPVVTGSYAGGGDIVPKDWLVDPVAFRYEGSYASKRPVYRAEDWAARASELIGKRCNRPGEYDWNRLWPERWEPYLREAAK